MESRLSACRQPAKSSAVSTSDEILALAQTREGRCIRVATFPRVFASWLVLGLAVLNRAPDALGRGGHLDVLDAELCERVDDRVDDGAERRRRPALAAAA